MAKSSKPSKKNHIILGVLFAAIIFAVSASVYPVLQKTGIGIIHICRM